jgi:ATP-binding cassette subfamily F protein uup
MEELDRLMPQRQAEVAELEGAMADPALFAADPAEFRKKAARLEAARAEVDAYEHEWLMLEEKRETLARS